jgi:meso-butanediol dehydrogenase / (S,S)-butanediol dehydrogenase / diacetyl reductase
VSRFAGKGVVVTGAAQGIGLGLVRGFLDEGAGVVAFDVNGDKLEAAVSELGGRAVAFVGDVSRRDDCRRSVEVCVERFGAIDVMCAHTGIAEPLPLLEMTEEHWRRHMAVNVDGVVFCAIEAARAMVAAAHPGSIVCTASVNAWYVEETHGAYNVTKGAVWNFIRSAAIDFAPYGIRVNGVAPGVVDTPIAALVVHNPELAPEYLKGIPLGRFGQPADVANAALFLASDDASYITGHTIVLDGGQTLGIAGDLEAATNAQEED